MDKLVLWQRYQNWLYYHKGLNLYLDISRISFDDGFVEALENKFQKAFDDMEQVRVLMDYTSIL
jgi:glucose-6-phosphate isomerase